MEKLDEHTSGCAKTTDGVVGTIHEHMEKTKENDIKRGYANCNSAEDIRCLYLRMQAAYFL